jgi:hypothetical protein
VVAGETPKVVQLPEQLLELFEVTVPTEDEFAEKLVSRTASNKKDNGVAWFKGNSVTKKVPLPMAMPFPAYLAYDAFTDDVPAHILWERIRVAEETDQCPAELFDGAKAFLRAAHTRNIQTQNSVSLPISAFTKRVHEDALAWGRARQEVLFPELRVVTAPATPQRNDISALLQVLTRTGQTFGASPTSVAALQDPEADCVKKYGMCVPDLHHFIKLCGLNPGQEYLLPAWIKKVVVKHQTTKEGKHRIIREMRTQLRYEDHPILLFPAVYKMIQDKAFGGG